MPSDYEKMARELMENFNGKPEDSWQQVEAKIAQALERAGLEGEVRAMQWAADRWTAYPIYPPSDAIAEQLAALRKRLEELNA